MDVDTPFHMGSLGGVPWPYFWSLLVTLAWLNRVTRSAIQLCTTPVETANLGWVSTLEGLAISSVIDSPTPNVTHDKISFVMRSSSEENICKGRRSRRDLQKALTRITRSSAYLNAALSVLTSLGQKPARSVLLTCLSHAQVRRHPGSTDHISIISVI